MSVLLRERFAWVEHLRKGLVFLLDDTIHPRLEVREGKDPLTALLVITLTRPLPKASRSAMRSYIRWWAQTGNCDVPKIDIEKTHIVAEVLFKHRHPRGRDEETDRRVG